MILILQSHSIMGWTTRWSLNEIMFDSSSSYKFKKRDWLLHDLAIKYDVINMKHKQYNLQLQNRTMDREITTKVSCFYFKQPLLSILHEDNIMNPQYLVFKNKIYKYIDFGRDKLKHNHDAKWYKSVFYYYNDKYGFDKNRDIYGVMFDIDKHIVIKTINFVLCT